MYYKFKQYLGLNENKVEQSYHSTGIFDFGSHLGSELSERLWNDLTTKLHAKKICILTIFDWEKFPTSEKPETIYLILDRDNTLQNCLLQSWYS